MASKPAMFSLFFFFIMLFAKEGSTESKIELGSRLSPEGSHNTSWASSSGHFAFGFYPQGNGFAVGIWLVSTPESEDIIVWTANRDSPTISKNSTLLLTNTGWRFLQSGKEGQYLISDFTLVASASMLDSGNFVLYGDNHTIIWQSFDHPTDTILGGQNLTENAELVSSISNSDHSSGRFFLGMQRDGNLVAYPLNSQANAYDAYWASNTYDGAANLALNISGSLCLNYYTSVRTPVHCLRNSTNTENSIYRATLDVDGNFRLYEHQFEDNGSSHVQVLWNTTVDKCRIRGFCGFNSYCSNVAGDAVCECFPGFVPSKSSGNVSINCIPAFDSKDDCKDSGDPTILYVTRLENIYWDDTPYSVIPMNKEACEKSLMEDCDCKAALYTDGNCKKYRLPLIYGSKLPDVANVALFKMHSANAISQTPNNTDMSSRKPKVVVDNKRSIITILAFTLGFISLLSLVFALSVFFTYRRQVYRYTRLLSSCEDLGFTEECSLRSFSFDELERSTRGFTEEIGRGSYGAVYRGTIGDSNRSIAVKRLERIADEGERGFRAEITAIARTHHRNLVKLIGFCIEGSRKLLVYEYVSNGSLANLLFKGEKRLSWGERLKIALDVARGVLYLHEECDVGIIHWNIKPRNILMDEAWVAKISDFGLARLLKPEYSRMNKEDDGMSKYLAPEWKKDAAVSVKWDIYSYGMVLLEIVCRRSSIDIDVSSAEEILLSSWVYQCFESGKLNKLVKDDGGEVVEWKLLERMVKVGLWCVQDDPFLRPSIKNLILMLEGLKDIPNPPCPAHLANNRRCIV
ncbi:G-type lectin S-receptor-like serine/threonine-protein kinase LECRK1 isoform X1 [Abrus precatorius]|uniref:Receptor-like serine/threonine-protein kinase n=1 Tax=Abrus precatorius TaxID=3816 RepID=A0A8B8JHT3_ABRPR|nr:G-type lectin S-receptor-like serine/threonine-protein kinase LECRK1 isoform X1 [Abrus precatorius]